LSAKDDSIHILAGEFGMVDVAKLNGGGGGGGGTASD